MLHHLIVLDVAAGARDDETQITLLPLSASYSSFVSRASGTWGQRGRAKGRLQECRPGFGTVTRTVKCVDANAAALLLSAMCKLVPSAVK